MHRYHLTSGPAIQLLPPSLSLIAITPRNDTRSTTGETIGAPTLSVKLGRGNAYALNG
jgi:hypothetical protein